MKTESAFWDALAPDLATIEDSFFDRRALRDILPNVEPPVLVVGAGQGLLVGELTARGMQCDGVDFSPLMIRYAKIRRNLDLIRADARELPVADHAYRTVIYATGVIDFTADESLISGILREGRRVVAPDGRIFIGFYRSSAAIERFLLTTGLLKDHVMSTRYAGDVSLDSDADRPMGGETSGPDCTGSGGSFSENGGGNHIEREAKLFTDAEGFSESCKGQSADRERPRNGALSKRRRGKESFQTALDTDQTIPRIGQLLDGADLRSWNCKQAT